ncbi:hypothetical protein E2C01_081122 [Portunus trituberculatus]|uniref:Uncharacterized protein n=1 Tax=Portunus trituberculatus TaxID=210409 RepID=A0A5B7IVT0_PORTR|nr:hypothetical protein [Portunus trituberculatus]
MFFKYNQENNPLIPEVAGVTHNAGTSDKHRPRHQHNTPEINHFHQQATRRHRNYDMEPCMEPYIHTDGSASLVSEKAPHYLQVHTTLTNDRALQLQQSRTSTKTRLLREREAWLVYVCVSRAWHQPAPRSLASQGFSRLSRPCFLPRRQAHKQAVSLSTGGTHLRRVRRASAVYREGCHQALSPPVTGDSLTNAPRYPSRPHPPPSSRSLSRVLTTRMRVCEEASWPPQDQRSGPCWSRGSLCVSRRVASQPASAAKLIPVRGLAGTGRASGGSGGAAARGSLLYLARQQCRAD